MGKYFTRTEHWYNFTNLKPIFEFTQDGLLETIEEGKFGPHDSLQVNAAYQVNSQLMDEHAYSIFDLSDRLLYGLMQKDDGTKMILASEFVGNAKPVSVDPRINEIIEVSDMNLDFANITSWKPCTDIVAPFTPNVYISDGRVVAGPFSYQREDSGYKFKPVCTSGEEAYLVREYNIEALEKNSNIYEFPAGRSEDNSIPYGKIRKLLFATETELPPPCGFYDYISDEDLKNYIARLLTSNIEIKKEKQALKNAILELPDTGITVERRKRIEKMFKNSESIDDFISYMPSLVMQNEDNLKKIVEEFWRDENYYANNDTINSYVKKQSGYQEIIRELEQQREKLESEVNYKSTELPALGMRTIGEDAVSADEKDKLLQQIQVLNEQLDNYKKTTGNIDRLKKDEAKLQKKVDVRKDDLDSLSKKVDSFSGKIENAYSNLFEYTFDGEIANLIMEASRQHQNSIIKSDLVDSYKAIRDEIEPSKISSLDELIDFLYIELTEKANREIEKNDVVNILLCLSQGFITILAGEPGTGKTSLVNLIANILGLTNKVFSRFIEIPVEKGWTSRSDFIGYYNPLSKHFEPANKMLYNYLQIVNCENSLTDKKYPFLILLDEANLSQMEYYWADFMALCDMDKKERTLTVAEDFRVQVPETLRFIATINLDHTTEVLSPRLIDRSWVIKLPSTDIDIESFETSSVLNDYPIISFEILKPFYDVREYRDERLNSGIVDRFSRLYKLFKSMNIYFSPRTMGMVKRFCLAGYNYFDKTNAYVTLDYAVSQKILPLINGYGSAYQKFIMDLLKECDGNSMPITNKILKNILLKGDNNMQYYNFFMR